VQMRASAAKATAQPAAKLGLNVIQTEAKDPIDSGKEQSKT